MPTAAASPEHAPRRAIAPARATPADVDATCALIAGLLLEPDDRLFVRALLASGDRARDAWTAWSHGCDWTNPSTARGRLAKAFAPLVLEAARAHHFTLERTAATTLRAWGLAEQERTRRYEDVLGGVMTCLASSHLQFLLIGGAALSATLYAHPSHRHCHDIDLLVARGDEARCVEALEAAGFARLDAAGRGTSVQMVHASQLSLIARHGGLATASNLAIEFDELFALSETAHVAGHDAKVLAPGHALVCTCVPALTTRRRVESARALVDMSRLVRARPAVGWPNVIDTAVRQELALLLAASLRFIADESATPTPAGVLDALVSPVAKSLARDRARVLPTLAGAPRSLGALARLPCTWQERILVGVTMLLPAAEHVRPATHGRGRMTVGVHHVQRIVRWLSRGAVPDSPARPT